MSRASRRRFGIATCVVALVAPVTACNPFEDPQTVDARKTTPCRDGEIVDLGTPQPRGRWATFELEQGPVWVAVDGWDAGILDPSPYRATIEVGPSDRPPEPDRNGNIASRTARVTVVEGKWSPLDITEGNYWLLASAVAERVRLQTCGSARVGSVTPAG